MSLVCTVGEVDARKASVGHSGTPSLIGIRVSGRVGFKGGFWLYIMTIYLGYG